MRSKKSTPRIISRSLRRNEVLATNEQPMVPNDVEKELQLEISMKGGVLVSNKRHTPVEVTIEKYLPPINMEKVNNASLRTRKIVTSEYENPNVEDNPFVLLPGVANEVESYPCPICGTDKVFLTVSGLRKHAIEAHPKSLDVVDTSIECIQNEWNRRRTRKLAAKVMRNGHSSLMVGKPSSVVAITPSSSMLDGNNDPNRGDGPPTLIAEHKPSVPCCFSAQAFDKHQFQVCKVCGTIVDTTQPSMMEAHLEAHQRDGETLDSVPCKECPFLCSSEDMLEAHMKMYHSRRKRFVCRWCGVPFPSMAGLNVHKLRCHNISTRSSRYFDVDYVPTTMTAGDARIAARNGGGDVATAPVVGNPQISISETAACTTCCAVCGMLIARPSILLRHMLRVHNQRDFSATVRSRYRVPLKFTIDERGRVTWSCCGENFKSRESCLIHRRQMHEPTKKYNSNVVDSNAHDSNVQEPIDVLPEMRRRGVDRQNPPGELDGQHHIADSLNVSEEAAIMVNRRHHRDDLSHHRLPAQMLAPLVEDAEEEDVVVDGMDEDANEQHQHQTQTFTVTEDAENDDELIGRATVDEDGRKSGHENIIVDDNDEGTDSVDFF